MNRIRNHVVVLLVSLSSAPVALGQTASAKVVAGSEHCREIHFPGGWKPTKGMQKAQQNHFARFDFGSFYEFRKTTGVTQEYLVAAVDGGMAPPRDYSPNKFWVNFRSGNVRHATQAEWDSGIVVPQRRHTKGVILPPQTDDGVLFRDRLFQKSGPQWPLITFEWARLSPDQKWVAVQSWEGKDYANGLGIIFPPRGGHGKFFIDLYEVSSGRKLAAIAGAERDTLEADEPLGLTFWIASRYFIVPLGSHIERMLVCEVATDGQDESVIDLETDTGPPLPYPLPPPSRSPWYFTGHNSATGIDANGVPGFEILRVQAGIFNPAGTCLWRGNLTDELGRYIDFAQGRETFSAGDNTIVLDFNGYKIARFGEDGRYRVADVVVSCGSDEIVSLGLFLTQPFQATQFEYAVADFTLIPSPTTATINPGGSARFRYALNLIAGFSALVNVTVSDLPPNATGTVSIPALIGGGGTYLTITTATNTPPGTYTVNVIGTSGSLTHSFPVSITVSAQN
jgi:hypothetical protein